MSALGTITGPTQAALLLLALGILLPALSLLHELGHALAALFLSRSVVDVRLGTGKHTLCLGRLQLHLSPSPRARCSWTSTGLSTGSRLAVVLAGPLASALLASAFAGAAPLLPSSLARIAVAAWAAATCQALGNLLPYRQANRQRLRAGRNPNGRASDGLQALELLSRNH